jgi:hypothetical protein
VWCGCGVDKWPHTTHKFDGHGQANGQKKTNVYNTPYAISGIFLPKCHADDENNAIFTLHNKKLIGVT